MSLICHCDHCLNETCTAQLGGFCFAEWKLASYNKDSGIEVVSKFNCYNKGEHLIKSLICENGSTIPSHVIRRCCNSKNFCNTDILPNKQEAIRKFHLYMSEHGNKTITESNQSSLSSFIDQISNSSVGSRFVFISFVLMLLAIIVSIAQNITYQNLNRRQAGRRFYLKHLKFWKNFYKPRRTSANIGVYPNMYVKSTASNAILKTQTVSAEDGSEHSLGKPPSETINEETNSMASREPLLQANLRQNILNTGPSQMTENSIGASFQMTIGGTGVLDEHDHSSGSGSGQPYLSQRSFAHDIELVDVIGRGFYGIVWRADYKGEPVAVKIFTPAGEASWQREADIHRTSMLRHKNILGLIATDRRIDGHMAGFWLVTDFYPMGSLYDFLRSHTLVIQDAFRMAFSISNGLSHLHLEILGHQGKPAIAHRDLKSKNILVRNDGTCAIADLGMAVRYSSETGLVDVPSNTRLGTRRYLAPEALSDSLNLMDFEAVKATDIYASGLVFWEILRRSCIDPSQVQCINNASDSNEKRATSVNSTGHEADCIIQSEDQVQCNRESSLSCEQALKHAPKHEPVFCDTYELPYENVVGVDPTIEQMRVVVCDQKIRPTMSARWRKNGPMREYAALMTECWYEKPQSRLSALRLRKSLSDIAKNYFNLSMAYD